MKAVKPRAAISIGLLILAGPLGLLAAGEPQRPVDNAAALSGTWALQQASSLDELRRLAPATIEPALKTPELRGFCLRVPWRAIDGDLALLEAGYRLALGHKLAYSVRFMAGRHSPERLFDAGSPYYTVPAGKRRPTAEKVPAPFFADGSPNTVFEREYAALVARLADWCRQRDVRLLHLAWYGQEWAELNHGKEVRSQPGYSYQNWLTAHQRLINIGLAHTGPTLSVELPFSGHGPLTDAAVDLADYVVGRIGANNCRFFCQANGWGPRGDWGAPNAATESAFDRVWSKPVCRGQQAIQPSDYDWPLLYARLRENRATYAEVYAASFVLPGRAALAAEIARFGRPRP